MKTASFSGACLAGVLAALAAGGVAPARAASPAAITVNGVQISGEAVQAEFRFLESQKKMFHPVSAERTEASLRAAVDNVIVWELVRQKLAAAGKPLSERDVEREITEERVRKGASFPKYLAMLGQDEASFGARKRNVLAFKKFLAEIIAPRQQVSEQEIKQRFDNAGTYMSAETYRAEYLQVFTAGHEGLPADGLAKAAERARALIVQGSSMEDAGKAVATAEILARVGGGTHVMGQGPIYEQAVAKLTPGEVGQVLQLTQNSCLVPRLLERVPARKLTLAEARPEILRSLREDKAQEAAIAAVEEMKKQASIAYLDKQYDLPPLQ